MRNIIKYQKHLFPDNKLRIKEDCLTGQVIRQESRSTFNFLRLRISLYI